MIFHLLYRSFSRGVLSENQIQTILKKSQENNLKNSISGLLLFKDRVFLQVLEGDEKTVMKIYEKIAKDERHFFPEILMTAQSENRIFPEWSMGLITERQIGKPLNSLTPLLQLAAKNQQVDQRLIVPYLQFFVNGKLQPAEA